MLRSLVLLLFWGVSSSSSSSSTITLLKGSQVKLQCIPESDLMFPKYSWSFSPQPEVKKHDEKIHHSLFDHTDGELKLNPVEIHHAGTYTCVVRGMAEMGWMKIKRIFTISVIAPEKIPFTRWLLLEGEEGEQATLPCFSSSETLGSFHSAEVRWFRITETGNGFEHQELKPAARHQSNTNKEIEHMTRQVYWSSDLQQPNWSIDIDALEPRDEALYRCDISAGAQQEKLLMELVVNSAPPPRCFNHSERWEACADPDSRSSESILRESLSDFSLDLYNKLNTMEPEGNLLLSPISIAVLLAQLLLGSRGETRAELERGLFLPTDFSCVHSEMKKLTNKMKTSVLVANQMLFRPELQLREAFINQSQEFYDSVPQKLTNDSAANVKLINDWVASKTQSRITALVDSVDGSAEFLLLNAVYFIGKWKGTFEVKTLSFTTLSGELLSVPTLYSSNFNLASSYIPELKAYVGKFPLTGRNSLYVLLPLTEGKTGLQDVESALTDSNIRHMVKVMSSIPPTQYEVSLPKVKLLVNTNLLRLLKKTALSGLFSDPNLCGLVDQSGSMPLSDARHCAFLSLTEKGVEASAASSVSFSRSFSNFNAARPFILTVFNEEIDSLLFMGRVLHPDK